MPTDGFVSTMHAPLTGLRPPRKVAEQQAVIDAAATVTETEAFVPLTLTLTVLLTLTLTL